ncbi:disease resistance family protein/LRR family protein [Forsythia ovata]|uniref:Disease resistance family protein/LRR family protein n=1 Tax=Forsythia ovata TaxID=205694 RepID=A0ABD1UFA4_9LAMI
MAKKNALIEVIFFILLSNFMHFANIRLISSQSHMNIKCMKTEKEALIRVKEGFSDPSGRLISWEGEDCCKWRGVVCNNETGYVIKLKLRNPFPNGFVGDGIDCSLSGKINPSLLNIKYLNYLDLSFNNFEGIEIPKFLGSLKKLRYFNISNAYFGGTIPPHIGNLSRLRYLDLSSYTVEPAENNLQWLSGLYSLEYLNLGKVDLKRAANQWLLSVNMLPSLQELHLPHCGLSVLPVSLSHVNFSSLSVLDLSKNDFNSSIPHWLFNLSKLSYLDLSSSNLQGTISAEFANMTSLRTLDLSKNYFLGGQLSKNLAICNLQKLDLSANNFSGEIIELIDGLSMCQNSKLEILNLGHNLELGGFLPDSIGNLRNLKSIALRENSFIGSIPYSIGNLSSLEELYLLATTMSGEIPESLGQLSSLVALDISEIQLKGVVTEAHFRNLCNLKELSVSKFSLSPNLSLAFNISTEWIPPFKLRYLKLRSCQVGPKFPPWLRYQNDLRTFILRNNGIVDSIPPWFWELKLELDELDLGYNQLRGRIPNFLKFSYMSTVYLNWNRFEGPLPPWSSNVSALYLSHNLFSGPIPQDIGDRLPLLTDIDLSQNSLNGSIPMSIGKLNTLTTLDLSNNHLIGKVPGFWENLPFLYVLDLANNSLAGPIPSSICSLSSLKFLMLSNNLLHGELPAALQNCTGMITLDLGDNRFSGNLPAWIGEKMSLLLILRLRSNLFNGNIPTNFCNLSSLHILDIAENHISGIIPSCVGDLSGMTSDLDTQLYEGQLRVFAKGRELLYKDTLYLVNLIDISSNNLSGQLPGGLNDLHKLGTLNLSDNHLTGKIPDKIGRLQRVETLDLSRNRLNGVIPPKMTDMTSLNHLNLSYNELWGRIPTGNQFSTLLDPSIYTGNPGLCGSPLQKKCSEENVTSGKSDSAEESEGGDHDKWWLFLSVGLGFAMGFWGVCGTLVISRYWRLAFFQFVDEALDWLFVTLVLNSIRLWTVMSRNLCQG